MSEEDFQVYLAAITQRGEEITAGGISAVRDAFATIGITDADGNLRNEYKPDANAIRSSAVET